MRPGLRRAGGALALLTALAVPAGAVMAGSDGGPTGPDDEGGTQPVTIELTASHSRFSPPSVSVPAGATVRFVVRNLDPIDHELIVGGPGVHRRHERGRDAHHHGEVPGEISVPADATVSTTWTAPPTGPVTFACHLPGHLAYGMSGVVLVTPRS